jgi:hypothetical protein
VPITRSDLLIFSAGLAAGAVAYATYPKWKGKVGPLMSGARETLGPLIASAVAGAGAAFADATAEVDKATEEKVDPEPGPASPLSPDSMKNGSSKAAPFPA